MLDVKKMGSFHKDYIKNQPPCGRFTQSPTRWSWLRPSWSHSQIGCTHNLGPNIKDCSTDFHYINLYITYTHPLFKSHYLTLKVQLIWEDTYGIYITSKDSYNLLTIIFRAFIGPNFPVLRTTNPCMKKIPVHQNYGRDNKMECE